MDWERLRSAAVGMADKVASATGEIVEKGKKQVDVLSLENKLSKAQRQLGALVYSLAQTGAEQPELVKQYIDEIAEIEQQILQASEETAGPVSVSAKAVRVCSSCGGRAELDANFCPRCGEKL